MKVLSIRQPWASIIIHGYKNYEFRSWKTSYRGKVLIHASSNVETEYLERFQSLGLDYPTSAIIGCAEITDCVEVTEEFENDLIKKNEMVYGATKGRAGYGLKIENVIKFDKIIPTKGELGFWNYLEPPEIMELMDNLSYGWLDENKNFYDSLDKSNCANYKLLSPKDIIKRGCGICWDQVEVERYYFRNYFDVKTFFLYYEDGVDDMSHTFLTFKLENKYYWFEHAWTHLKGIYTYDSMEKLLEDVKKKFISILFHDKLDSNNLHCFLYKKPKIGLSVEEFYNTCKNGEEMNL